MIETTMTLTSSASFEDFNHKVSGRNSLAFARKQRASQRSARCRSNFRCAAIRSAVIRRPECGQQRNRLREIYFAFLVWDSVCARHTELAETAARPSQGRRSRNVMTMVALFWSFIDFPKLISALRISGFVPAFEVE